jgi:hypothetical protein
VNPVAEPQRPSRVLVESYRSRVQRWRNRDRAVWKQFKVLLAAGVVVVMGFGTVPFAVGNVLDGALAHAAGIPGTVMVIRCEQPSGRASRSVDLRDCEGRFRSADGAVVIPEITLMDPNGDLTGDLVPAVVRNRDSDLAWRAGNWLWWTNWGLMAFAAILFAVGGPFLLWWVYRTWVAMRKRRRCGRTGMRPHRREAVTRQG